MNVVSIGERSRKKTLKEVLVEILATMEDDSAALEVNGGILVLDTDAGLYYVHLAENTTYGIVGMLESCKLSLLDSMGEYGED